MKSNVYVSLVLLSFCLCSNAIAEETPTDFNKWSVTIAAGSNNIQISDTNVDDTIFSGAFEVGYQLNKNFGIKVGSRVGFSLNFLNIVPILFGQEVNTYDYDSQYFAATARTDEDLHVFGSLGIAHISELLGSSITGNDLSASSNKLYWEAGIGWDISNNFGVGISYTDTSAEFADVSTVQFKIKIEF